MLIMKNILVIGLPRPVVELTRLRKRYGDDHVADTFSAMPRGELKIRPFGAIADVTD